MAYLGAGITRFNTADDLTVTGDAQIDTNTLVVDSTNNRVGILNASPATALDVTGTLTADDIVLSGGMSKTGDLTFDISGDIILDADDNGKIQLHDGGTYYGLLRKDNNNFQLYSIVQDGDMVFRGNDGGSNVTALTLDMSAAGAATFNSSVDAGAGLRLSTDGSNNAVITALGQDKDIYFSGDDGGSGVNALILDMSDAGTAIFNNNVGIGTSSITSGFKLDVIGDARFSDAAGDDAVELGWSGGGSVGFVQAYDRGASAFRNLSLNNAMTINSSGNVMIGTTVAPDNAAADDLTLSGTGHIGMTIRSTDSTSSRIYFADATSGTGEYAGYLLYNHQNNSLQVGTNSAERIRVDSDGIKFNGDTAAANALDDYETGTWTPAISYGNIVINYASYVKVGQLVIAYCYIRADGVPSNGTTFLISGLPFTANNNSSYYPLGSLGYTGNFNTNNWTDPHVAYNNSYLYFHRNDGNSATITNADVTGANRELIVQVYYHTTI